MPEELKKCPLDKQLADKQAEEHIVKVAYEKTGDIQNVCFSNGVIEGLEQARQIVRPTEDRLREENKSLLTERTEVMEILAEAMGHESVGDHAPLTMADAVAKALVSLRRQVGEVLELLQAVAKSEQSRICCGHGDYRHYLTVGWELEGKIKQFLDSLTTPAEEGSGE